ncbi:MAG TPA: hypothetical protein VH560_07305 [Polyangia bacterium]|jgi:hypothetical protein|nr:hypothetical protein [Polyangia bacterium]
MRVSRPQLCLSFVAVALVACTSSENKTTIGTAGASGGTAGAGSAGASGGSAGSTAGLPPPGSAGTNGSAGASAGATGAAGTGTGPGGATGTAGASTSGSAGSSSNTDGGTQIVDGAPVTTAGCANHDYVLCNDFENGLDTTVWGTHANAGAIEATEFAHGSHAYHLYSKAGQPAGGTMVATNLGAITSQIWGRFYIRFSPGAPGGHGNLIGASDGVWSPGGAASNYNGDWYEIGWQFDGIMGDFHLPNNAERPLRSMPYLVDQWYCVEMFIDGTVKGNEKWWIDGTEAKYYTPQAGVCCAAMDPTTPESVLIPQFKSITVGWTPYAGLGLQLPDQNKIVDSRVLNDAWIDDVAFDTQRIGCIQ